jgi:two-component system cell cycle response regulator CtrA
MQILYVEDNPSEAKVLEAMLQSEGHVCHTTDLGRQALVLAKRNKYDLIILDIMLPDIDGYEVIGRLRKAEVRTPVLLQTGLFDRDDGGAEPGADDCLIKPFSKKELSARMKAALAKPPQPAPKYRSSERQKDPREIPVERRRHKRFSTVKTAEIVQDTFQLRCLVMNQSFGGAGIRLPKPGLQCPSRFELRLCNGDTRKCEVRWRDGDKMGVKFV